MLNAKFKTNVATKDCLRRKEEKKGERERRREGGKKRREKRGRKEEGKEGETPDPCCSQVNSASSTLVTK